MSIRKAIIAAWFAGTALVQAQTSEIVTGATPVVTSSIVLHLRFADGIGTVAADSSGYANNAQLKNAPQWGSNTFAGAIKFDGIKSYAKVPDSVSIDTLTTQMSVSAWVWREANADSTVLSRQTGTTANNHYFLGFLTNSFAFGVTTTTGTKVLTGAEAPLGQWSHVVGVYDGQQIQLYVNGSLVGSTAQSGEIETDTTAVMIGGVQRQATETLDSKLKGWVQDVRLYGGAISIQDIGGMVHPNNRAPVANTGGSRSIAIGSTATLNGNNSIDPDGGPQPLTYSWTQVSGPATTIKNSTQAFATITPLEGGSYVLRLTVSDGVTSAYDQMTLTVTAPDNTAPSVPTGVAVVTVSTNQLNVSWNASTDTGGSGMAGYRVYRSGVLVTNTTATSYLDRNLTAGTQYCYTIVAYDNAAQESAASVSVCGTTTTLPAPSAPTGLVSDSFSDTAIDLTWNDNSNNETGFIIERSTAANGPWVQIKTVGANVTTYRDTGLNPLTTYFYRVFAFN